MKNNFQYSSSVGLKPSKGCVNIGTRYRSGPTKKESRIHSNPMRVSLKQNSGYTYKRKKYNKQRKYQNPSFLDTEGRRKTGVFSLLKYKKILAPNSRVKRRFHAHRLVSVVWPHRKPMRTINCGVLNSAREI